MDSVIGNSGSVHREFFYSQLNKFYSKHKNGNKKPVTMNRYNEIIETIMNSKVAAINKQPRTNNEYYLTSHYDIIEVDGIKKLMKKGKNKGDSLIFVVPYEEIYDKLLDCHQNTGHGGRDKMKTTINHKYYIHRTCIEIFLKCCKQCSEKKPQRHKAVVTKPIRCGLFDNDCWNHRGQVDLIDFQSTPDGEYKWLLNYQDHRTKFVHLRPLKSNRDEEVAFELLKIFLEFGAPAILQSDNGREFVNSIVTELVSKWPACKIITGRPGQPQGSVERSNQDVESMLLSWLNENNSQHWAIGCYYVQWNKNSSYHRVLGRSPYKALFGVDFKMGLKSSNLPQDIIETIRTEEELCDILKNDSD